MTSSPALQLMMSSLVLQVQLGDKQEEELITVDAVGCFEEEEEEVEVVDEDEETAPSEVQGSEVSATSACGSKTWNRFWYRLGFLFPTDW